MIMLCVLYCIPLLKLVYFASGPLLVLIGMFALKRGIRNRRMGLRKTAIALMFAGALKPLVFDIHLDMAHDLICGIASDAPPAHPWCSVHGFKMLKFGFLVLFAVLSIVFFQLYRVCVPDRKVKDVKPEDVNLRFWVNLSLAGVILMACWSLAPWVGFLTIGRVAHIFEVITWQQLSMANAALLLWGFWKLEGCVWEYKVAEKKDRRNANTTRTWTPKDTLWMTVFLFLLTMGMSYVSEDTLTPKDPQQQRSHGVSIDEFEDMLPKTVPPKDLQQEGDGLTR
ncbi:MAG: hypothetical protein GC185_12375 [Alphaproteobacteria bacterium]|nr:hypothetical protein [Alphaproteobacteria bacterium]